MEGLGEIKSPGRQRELCALIQKHYRESIPLGKKFPDSIAVTPRTQNGFINRFSGKRDFFVIRFGSLMAVIWTNGLFS